VCTKRSIPLLLFDRAAWALHSGRSGRALVRVVVFIALGFVFDACTVISFAQEMSNLAPKDGAQKDVSRDKWSERVAAAKRRAQQWALEHRGHSVSETPSMADLERIASERVLNDDNLQRGDIVSTNKGLFVFIGQPSDRERRESDFIPLPPR
jgi:hypothetical protein